MKCSFSLNSLHNHHLDSGKIKSENSGCRLVFCARLAMCFCEWGHVFLCGAMGICNLSVLTQTEGFTRKSEGLLWSLPLLQLGDTVLSRERQNTLPTRVRRKAIHLDSTPLIQRGCGLQAASDPSVNAVPSQREAGRVIKYNSLSVYFKVHCCVNQSPISLP